MKSGAAILICAASLLAGGAQAETLASMQKNLDRYLPYLQGPVDGIPFERLTEYATWPIGPDKVLVRMWREKRAYLVTVDLPCQQLPWVTRVHFNRRDSAVSTGSMNSVVRRGDEVVAGTINGRDYCPIKEIQSIDYARMVEDGQANRYR